MLLDEFILAGEVQETSKQVILGYVLPPFLLLFDMPSNFLFPLVPCFLLRILPPRF